MWTILRPDYFCNIIGGPIISSNGHKYNVDFNTSKLTITSTDEAVGTFETKPFMHLRLSGHEPGWSIFENDVADQLRILVTWPGDEQNRWKAFVAGEEYIKNAVTVTPLDADEKAWVKRVYKHEYRFLAQHGLSIHVQDDRVLGWKLAREEMKHRVATEQTLVKVNNASGIRDRSLIPSRSSNHQPASLINCPQILNRQRTSTATVERRTKPQTTRQCRTKPMAKATFLPICASSLVSRYHEGSLSMRIPTTSVQSQHYIIDS
jgi:hypothetical protein